MEYEIEFITWLEEHVDLCEEQFKGSSIIEYLRGHYEWYDVILWDMGSECFPESHNLNTEFDQRLKLLYEMYTSGEIKHRPGYPIKKLSISYEVINIEERFIMAPEPDLVDESNQEEMDEEEEPDGPMSTVTANGLYGNLHGLFDYECDISIADFYEGLAAIRVEKDNFQVAYGFINIEGDVVISPRFEDVDYQHKGFSEGLAAVAVNEEDESQAGNTRWGYINKAGEIEIRAQYNEAFSFKEGLASVEIAGKWGYINKNGILVIEPIYDDSADFVKGIANVRVAGKCGYIDRKGAFVIEPIFDSYGYFAEGLAVVEINDKYGFINIQGEFVIEPKYEAAMFFDEGFASVRVEDKCGLINKQGDFVIEPRYRCLFFFSKGLAVVEVDGKVGCINIKGDFVVENKFDYIYPFFRNGLTTVRVDEKYGCINSNGDIVIEPLYYELDILSDRSVRVGVETPAVEL